MSSSSSTSAPVGPWRRAWAASLAFHAMATFALGVLVHQMPRGADLGLGSGMVIELGEGGGPADTGQEPTTLLATSDPPAPTFLDANPSNDFPPVEPFPPILDASPTVAANLAPLVPAPPPTSSQAELQASIEKIAAGLRSGSADSGIETPPATAPQPTRGRAPGQTRGSRFDGSGGSRSTVEVFGVKGTGTKFVYLFDRSTSMEGAPLAAAKRQLIASLQALDSLNQFQIIFFNARPYPIDVSGRGRMAFADDRSKKLAANMIGNVTADLGTDRYSALKAAFAYSPDVIFFLTDADDAMLMSEVSDLVRQNERIGAMICVIEFGRDAAPPAENFLKQLARESGGQYGYINAATLGR